MRSLRRTGARLRARHAKHVIAALLFSGFEPFFDELAAFAGLGGDEGAVGVEALRAAGDAVKGVGEANEDPRVAFVLEQFGQGMNIVFGCDRAEGVCSSTAQFDGSFVLEE